MKVRKRIFYFIKVLFSDIGVCVFRCVASMVTHLFISAKKVHRHINTEEYIHGGFSYEKTCITFIGGMYVSFRWRNAYGLWR